MTQLNPGRPAEVRATVTITRAATGKQEQVELVGYVTAEQAQALGLPAKPQEISDECDPRNLGA